MFDTLNWVRQRIDASPPTVLNHLGLSDSAYLLCTVHRSENTDNMERLSGIVAALAGVNERVIFPVHPRTQKALESRQIQTPANVSLIEPLGYLEMIALARSARMILTDSGGLQKEAYWLAVPCVTLREETEWTETVDAGWNVLAGSDTERIMCAVRGFTRPAFRTPLYGEGGVAAKCVALLGNE
jgi:UDP-N-acetylglucosamine 2-epimerase